MGTEGHNTRVIAGRYRLEARLGRGGMGVVWRATDQLLGRGVAVKELPFDESLSAAEARRQRDRTLREARAIAQLSHPHIIVVHDVVEDDERPYIVMELIEGGSLADRLATQGPVDAAEAARIGIALLGALRAAHAAGVLHRDLKPDNVLLEDGTDRIVLTDFGIAQVAGAPTLTENGSFVGSPEYTAPERMSGVRTGPESDLWSLGALLCAALSGESPFHRDSLGGVLHAVVVGDIRPPAQAGPLLPVVQGLLERDPDRRLDADRAERMLRVFRDTGSTPQAPPPGYAPTVRGAPHGRPQDDAGRRPPVPPTDMPGPDQRYEQMLRQPTRRVLVAALLVAAVAGAGVSAAALLMEQGDGGGGRTPTSSAPKTPSAAPSTHGTRTPSTPAATDATTTAATGITPPSP
ncbi:serine/threonine-protein kinase [Streptomyces coeruleorubidus]|uniref:serine/threonine-protein kinase n=1 Tax=Streptomyces coeruleorubidus TaxID=116188 RepID=UPI0038062F35